LREFDVWITPYLGDIRETSQFKNTLAAIVRAFDRLCQATNGFASEAELNHTHLADNLVKQLAGKDRDDILRIRRRPRVRRRRRPWAPTRGSSNTWTVPASSLRSTATSSPFSPCRTPPPSSNCAPRRSACGASSSHPA
jgi:hypothetical protein